MTKLLAALRDYHLAEGQTARGPVIVLGREATIDGHATDDVDPLAKVHGGVNETVLSVPDIDGNWNGNRQGLLSALALVGTVVRLFVVFSIASVLTLITPNWVRQISGRAGDGRASAAAIGVACQVAFFPVLLLLIAVLTVSIVGIPLIGAMPFLVVAAGVAGTAAVAARIGARLRGSTLGASNAL